MNCIYCKKDCTLFSDFKKPYDCKRCKVFTCYDCYYDLTIRCYLCNADYQQKLQKLMKDKKQKLQNKKEEEEEDSESEDKNQLECYKCKSKYDDFTTHIQEDSEYLIECCVCKEILLCECCSSKRGCNHNSGRWCCDGCEYICEEEDCICQN